MRIEKFWLVVKPQPLSEQVQGRLDPQEIHAVFTARDEAEREGARILAAFKRYYSDLQGNDEKR